VPLCARHYSTAAYAREKQVQNWSRAKREALIERKNDLLPILAKKDFSKRKADS
jgi:putative endonuclease